MRSREQPHQRRGRLRRTQRAPGRIGAPALIAEGRSAPSCRRRRCERGRREMPGSSERSTPFDASRSGVRRVRVRAPWPTATRRATWRDRQSATRPDRHVALLMTSPARQLRHPTYRVCQLARKHVRWRCRARRRRDLGGSSLPHAPDGETHARACRRAAPPAVRARSAACTRRPTGRRRCSSQDHFEGMARTGGSLFPFGSILRGAIAISSSAAASSTTSRL